MPRQDSSRASRRFEGRGVEVEQAVARQHGGSITPSGRHQIRELVASLKGDHSVTCEGYTDYGGLTSWEMTLSAARAEAVCHALTADGAHVHTTTIGYGDARPVIIGDTPTNRAPNRRVVIYINN